MSGSSRSKNSIEILEQRIAPAGLINESGFKFATPGAAILLHAGEGLTTGTGAGSGKYLLYVEKGTALVFTTDLNNNKVVDFNEITGIAAGDGLRLISFVDIHGDIVTNLRADDTLSDSDNNSSNNDINLRGDGLILLNSSIEKIELRSVTATDFSANSVNDLNGDGEVDEAYLQQRLVLSSYSIFGNVIAGKGFGATNGGLIIDAAGKQLQQDTFTPGNTNPDLFFDFTPSVDSILTGTAASGRYFSFGVSRGDNVQGYLGTFQPAVGQVGGDIIGVKATNVATEFNIASLEAGGGGIGARGGNIQNIQLNGDTVGGYRIIAGDGGRGPTGGAGGGILNFSDLGSVTGAVVIKTGSGGQGTTGAGGNGGTATFGTLNLSANLQILLGDGGDGFSSGGNGSGLNSANILTPEGTAPFGINLVGLGTDPSGNLVGRDGDEIGTGIPIDFNQDGVGDFVYTTDEPNQLVVVLGNPNALTGLPGTQDHFIWGYDGFGNPLYNKVYLDGTANAEGVVVADFNGDGWQDIAIASNTDGAFDGITVYLARFENVAAGQDADGDGLPDFIGFELGRHSTLPSLYSLDPEFPQGDPFYRRAAINVSDITAGDFDGDGVTDIAAIATYYNPLTLSPEQVLVVLTNDVENGKGTGHFYADFGTKATPQAPAVFKTPFLPILTNAGPGSVKIEASKVQIGDAYDSIFVGGNTSASGGFIAIIDFVGNSPLIRSTTDIGEVDTNRDLQIGTSQNVTLSVGATLRDFTVLDYDNDGLADVAVLTEIPVGFLIGMHGEAGGSLSITTNKTITGESAIGQNFGIFFGDKGLGVGSAIFGIRAADTDGDGKVDEVLALNFSPTIPLQSLTKVSFTGGPERNQLASSTIFDGITTGGRDNSVIAFDSVAKDITGNRSYSYGSANPTKMQEAGLGVIDFPGQAVLDIALTDNSVSIQTGNGGDSLAGKGGSGGVLGGSLITKKTTDPLTGVVTTDLVGAVNITLPENESYDGEIKLFAGRGGNGFATGGSGGNINGLTLRYADTDGLVTLHSFATVIAGDGGYGVSGAGGNGGSITANSIQSGRDYVSGDGGRGATGGNGGSIIGNGRKGFYDTLYNGITLNSGNGGVGVKQGGHGGEITNFAAEFVSSTGFAGGFYSVIAGSGGNAVLGNGGRGGSITNSGPLQGENRLAGEIYVQAGDGGRGLTGGAGGSIVKFLHKPSISDNPPIVSFLAGHGGAGVTGNGGAGGSVSGVDTPSNGSPSGFLVSGYGYDRVLAGNGGTSAGAIGGAGGSVSSSTVGAADGPLVVVGGTGGNGLKAGGVGGSVTSFVANAGNTPAAKILVIAGAGGDGYAFIANPIDSNAQQLKSAQQAFGGVVGRGGQGGSITNFAQEGDVKARVDLIAGNGGNTANYGSPADTKPFVGGGGSVTNIKVRGNIGNLSPDDPNTAINEEVPITAYNDLDKDGHIDQSLADFVREKMRIAPADTFFNPPVLLDDKLGNVGIIVGAAGRIKESQSSPGVFVNQAASFALNGSLINVTAGNLMSAVAGGVDAVAAIQVASGIKIGSGTPPAFTPGIVGADKSPTIPGNDYLDEFGNAIPEPKLGGRLVDGAVVAHKITDILGLRAFIR